IGLAIDLGGIELGGGSGNRGIAEDDLVAHAARDFDAQRKWGDVEQQHVLGGFRAAAENVGLHGCAEGHHLIRIKAGVRHALEQVLNQFPHLGNARGTAHQHDLVNLLRLKIRIFQSLPSRANGAVQDGLNQLLELLARDFAPIPLAAGKVNIEPGRGLGRQRNFGLDYRFAYGLHGLAAAPEIESHVAADIVERDVDEQVIDIVATQVSIAVGGDNLKDAVLLLVQTIGKRRGGGFIDQAQNFEAGDAPGVLRSLTLGVIEVGGHRDHSFRDRLAKET